MKEMKLVKTRNFGSGNVYLMVSKEEYEKFEAKKLMRETANHIRKLRKKRRG